MDTEKDESTVTTKKGCIYNAPKLGRCSSPK